MMRHLSLVVLALAVGGCQQEPVVSPPETAYRHFAEALRSSDAKTAWESLSTPTRATLAARSKAIAAASQGLIRDEPLLMVLQSGVKPREIGTVKVKSSGDRGATLEVAAAGQTQEVQMVKESAQWLVELSDVLSEVTNRD